MAPKAASDDSSALSSLTSLFPLNAAGLELSFSSHSISKPKARLKKPPIIRVVHVVAPTLIKTNVANFRMLVQELTGNHPAAVAQAQEVKEESTGHDLAKELDLRYQKEKETTLAATTTSLRRTQFEEDYEDPFLQHGIILQSESASNHAELATSNAYSPANQAGLATIEERDAYIPVLNQGELAGSDEGISYFNSSANYDYDDTYSHDSSPSSLDTSSTRGDSHSIYERGNNACVFGDELDLMGAFNSSYPLISLDDDQHLPQDFMNALNTKLEFSLLNPTW